jgi:hypothetical protein
LWCGKPCVLCAALSGLVLHSIRCLCPPVLYRAHWVFPDVLSPCMHAACMRAACSLPRPPCLSIKPSFASVWCWGACGHMCLHLPTVFSVPLEHGFGPAVSPYICHFITMLPSCTDCRECTLLGIASLSRNKDGYHRVLRVRVCVCACVCVCAFPCKTCACASAGTCRRVL